MIEDHEAVAMYRRFNEAFNAGEFDTCASYLAENFTGMASGTYMGSPGEFIQAARNGRANGWVGQHVSSLTARNGLLTAYYVNVFADGSSTEGVGIMQIDEAGKFCAVRALNRTGATPMTPSS